MSADAVIVKFAREFRIKISALETRLFPPGWAGRVEADIAAAADKAGALLKEGIEKIEGKAPDVTEGTVAEMKAWLDAHEPPIEYAANAKKADLVALIEQTRAADAAAAEAAAQGAAGSGGIGGGAAPASADGASDPSTPTTETAPL